MIKDDGSGVAGGLVKVIVLDNLCLDTAGDNPGERNGGLRLLFDGLRFGKDMFFGGSISVFWNDR